MEGTHWRESARTPRFFMIDGRAAFPMLLFLLHIRGWTFIVALIATAFFALLEHYGFTMIIFARWFRNLLAGKRKISMPWWLY